MDDREIERLIGQDFSSGEEAFGESLLRRCLEVTAQGDICVPISDEKLDVLAAAGDVYSISRNDNLLDDDHLR